MNILGLKLFTHTPFLSNLIGCSWSKIKCSKEKLVSNLTVSSIFYSSPCMSLVTRVCLHILGGGHGHLLFSHTKKNQMDLEEVTANVQKLSFVKPHQTKHPSLEKLIQAKMFNIIIVSLWDISKQDSEHHQTFSAGFLRPDCVQSWLYHVFAEQLWASYLTSLCHLFITS